MATHTIVDRHGNAMTKDDLVKDARHDEKAGSTESADR